MNNQVKAFSWASLWRFLPAVRRSEREKFLFFLSLSGIITLAQTLGLVGAETLLLSRLGAPALPITFIGASALTVLGSLIYAFGVDRSRNDNYFIHIFIIFSCLIGLLCLGIQHDLTWLLPVLYSVYYLSLAVLTNHYWTFTGDYFNTLAAKRLFPLFVVGSSAGGVLGGIAVTLLGNWAPPNMLLAAWIFFLLAAATLLKTQQRRLRRWGPLELEEADETSLEGMLSSIRYLRYSKLGRWLVLSALGMVLALFVSQYLYSDIFVRSFADPRRLSMFLGIFTAITNFLEILLEVFLTPWLIQHLGVPSANLLHPILTISSFLLLAFDYSLAAACLARVNRETIENAVSAPVRNLVFNALPARLRGRMRAFLEGMVVYSGMVIAGVFLLSVKNVLSPFWLCVAGSGTALLYLAANLKVRQEYLATLVSELRKGRLDLDELGVDLARLDKKRLLSLWESLLKDQDIRAAVQLSEPLARAGLLAPLTSAYADSPPELRAAIIDVLGKYALSAAKPTIVAATKDNDPCIRLRALQYITHIRSQDPKDITVIQELLEDNDPRVKALAAVHCGESGRNILLEMLNSTHQDLVKAALQTLPYPLADKARPFLLSPNSDIRLAAMQRLAELKVSLPKNLLEPNLRSPDPKLRLAAVQLLLYADKSWSPIYLAGTLGDPQREVRLKAAELLSLLAGANGENNNRINREETPDLIALIKPYLSSENHYTVQAAINALSRIGVPIVIKLLESALKHSVEQAWRHLASFHHIPNNSSITHRFLRVALQNAVEQEKRTAFHILSALEDPTVMRSVEKVLRFSKARIRNDALEVISNLGEKDASRLLVLLLEEGELDDKLPQLKGELKLPTNLEEALQAARSSPDRWVRSAAIIALDGLEEGTRREETMERLLVLKRVPLFSRMTLDQLDAINRLLTEEEYMADEVIFQEGDIGDELYILIEGEVLIVKSKDTPEEMVLATMKSGDYFGEMAILDDEPRSAAVVCKTKARLLVLKGEQLKELVYQMPEIAFEIFKVLTSRIRSADHRLNEMMRDLQHIRQQRSLEPAGSN